MEQRLIDANALMEYCNNLVDKTIDANDIARFPTAMGWISVKDRLPEDDGTVLAVKQLKDGTRQICLACCNLDWMYTDPVTGVTTHEPRWVCGGNNNIIYWMKLPGIPEEAKA